MQWIEQNRWQQNAKPHKHNYFVIIWVRKGSGLHLIDLKQYELQDNTVYCLAPGQVHLMKAATGTEGCVISFTEDFLSHSEENHHLLYNSGLFDPYTGSPAIPITFEMQEELESAALKMQKEFENFFLLRSEILRGYLKIFLIYLTRQFEPAKKEPSQSRNIELTRHFLSLLETHYASRKMVQDYAGELAVTANYLNEVIKKVTGMPASEHIRNRIVLEAKRQGLYADVSMKEVAYHLGFDDVAHFSKYFKKATGVNYTDFKKTLANPFQP